jgi:hypothetical protein
MRFIGSEDLGTASILAKLSTEAMLYDCRIVLS